MARRPARPKQSRSGGGVGGGVGRRRAPRRRHAGREVVTVGEPAEAVHAVSEHVKKPQAGSARRRPPACGRAYVVVAPVHARVLGRAGWPQARARHGLSASPERDGAAAAVSAKSTSHPSAPAPHRRAEEEELLSQQAKSTDGPTSRRASPFSIRRLGSASAWRCGERAPRQAHARPSMVAGAGTSMFCGARNVDDRTESGDSLASSRRELKRASRARLKREMRERFTRFLTVATPAPLPRPPCRRPAAG